jgi:hypothetical protein
MLHAKLSVHRTVYVTAITFFVLVLCLLPQQLDATRYVATTGSDAANDCSNSGTPCATIQVAIDSATAGEDIRVAEGTYSGSQVVIVNRSGTNYSYKQVVFIDKGLTLRGGYHVTDWTISDPELYITEINAESDGRPVTIVDTFDDLVVLDGLLLTDGDYTGLGNPTGLSNHVCRSGEDEDCGGGLYVYNSALHLLNSEVRGNVASTVAGDGGGIYLWDARQSTIESTRVADNGSPYGGGGIYVTQQDLPLTIRETTFLGNTSGYGGGVNLATNISALVRVQDCELIENTAVDGKGGGLYARLSANGLVLEMERVVVDDNKAWEQGKGVYLDAAGSFTPEASLVNVLFSTNNEVDGAPTATQDAVLAVAPQFTSLKATLAHVTAGPNQAPTFLYAMPDDKPGKTVEVTAANVLLSGFQNGFAAEEAADGEATIEHTNTLLHNVVNQHWTVAGTPTFTSVGPVIGDPLLDATYRLQAGSAAIDTGVDVGVTHDIDHGLRPFGSAPDIGIDEFGAIFADGFESGDTSAWSSTVQ